MLQKTQFNIPEETRYVSSMTPTGFINGQDESRCYVNSLFQVVFFDIFFSPLIMNIDCDEIMENMDSTADYYRSYIQKIVILQVIQKIFCQILIGERKNNYTDSFF